MYIYVLLYTCKCMRHVDIDIITYVMYIVKVLFREHPLLRHTVYALVVCEKNLDVCIIII